MLKKKEKSELKFFYGMTPEEDAYYKTLIKVKGKEEEPTLAKSVLNMLNGPGQEIHRLAFETDPTAANTYAGVYKQKMRLLPDSVLKRIAIQDSLVSNIVRARQNHVKAFGRPRPNIYSTGFIISPKSGVTEAMDENQRVALAKEINDAVALLNTCGHTEGVRDHHQKTFSEYLDLLARDSQVVGRIASEIVYVDDVVSGEKKFHYFCHTDAGTIYPAAPDDNNAKQALRDEAFQLLQTVNGEKLEREKWHNNNYNWIQVIDGRPQQAFTSDEMKCRNFYPAGNVELDGFPVTPIDTVITAITTHLNITTHNKVYFQNGRASRGMIIIQSDDVTPSVIHNIKQQFNSSINGADKAWRMPVLGFGSETQVTWQPIDQSGSRDMEFQYLTDLNAREILTAFMMSPDELPGWGYLSRGTNSQALSESNQEFKLTAARDVGIRPLIAGFEDFINEELFPLIAPELSKICRVELVGLDAETPEKEIVGLQQNSQVHMTYNDILIKKEKKPLPKHMCGDIPLNPGFQKLLDAYKTVGEIREFFLGIPGASKDPKWDYCRDPMYFQNIQLQMQAQQMQMQQQQMQMQAMQPQQPPPGGPDDGGGDDGGGEEKDSGPEDLARSIDQAYEMMKKSEENLSPNQRRLLAKQQKTLKWAIDGFQNDTKDAVAAILDEVKNLSIKKR